MKENERPFASDVEKNSNDARNGQTPAPVSLLPTTLASLGLEGSGAQASQSPASVTDALQSEQWQERLRAVRLLAVSEASLEPLASALHDPAWQVRATVVFALA